jgi:hypothetical protein
VALAGTVAVSHKGGADSAWVEAWRRTRVRSTAKEQRGGRAWRQSSSRWLMFMTSLRSVVLGVGVDGGSG